MYPILQLTSTSPHVLKGTVKVIIARTKEKIEAEVQKADHEEALFVQLKAARRKIAGNENVPAYIVLSDATLMELATCLPHNKDEFRKISGFGEVKIEKYGKYFWDVVADYCRERQLTSRIHLKTPKRIRKERPERETDTKQQSFDLFVAGNSMERIAELRGMSQTTIEGHLAFYVQQGRLKIDQFMDTSKIPAIKQAMEQSNAKLLAPIKAILGDNYSYGEVRLAMAHLEFLAHHN